MDKLKPTAKWIYELRFWVHGTFEGDDLALGTKFNYLPTEEEINSIIKKAYQKYCTDPEEIYENMGNDWTLYEITTQKVIEPAKSKKEAKEMAEKKTAKKATPKKATPKKVAPKKKAALKKATPKKVAPPKPRHYENEKTFTYSSYSGKVADILRRDKKALRISYPTFMHRFVVSEAEKRGIRTSQLYKQSLEEYFKKNQKQFDGTVQPIESLAKEKKFSLAMLQLEEGYNGPPLLSIFG